MNVIDYINKYGDYSFKEKSFNEVDNAILSLLAYLNYSDIVSNNNRKKIRLEDAASILLSKIKDVVILDVPAVKEALTVLKVLKSNKRYRDILLYNYKYIYSNESQFSCLTFEINKKYVYVAFEGTDKLISGWIEDAKMSYEYPVKAHINAINYLNKNFRFNRKKIIVGGHSKGGNIALVSALECKKNIYKRIINVYSNDGQGLRKEDLNKKRYSDLKSKYIHICPYNSVVGMLLYQEPYFISVDSDKPVGFSHAVTSWQLDDDHFKTREVSTFSKILYEGFNKWLDNYDYDSRREFVESIGKLLSDNGIVTVVDFKNNTKLAFEVAKDAKNLNPIVKEMTGELLKIIVRLNIENKFM
ncbi:MAG: DUF2974 domain-containing protein [Bacilli bacterium]|nr:DUF2974 domain-containing protein [Bacilli bacterium]